MKNYGRVPTRRGFMALAAGPTALAVAGTSQKARAQVSTSAKIVIPGAGAAGAALANRLVERLDGADITLVDGRKEHWYQPEVSLIAAGLKPSGYSVSQTTDWLPYGVTLKDERGRPESHL